jgi:hypothetical protein
VPPAPSEVDAVYDRMPSSTASVARALRAAVSRHAPDLRESVKWNNPFWVGRKDVLCLQCYDDHVNFGVMRGAELVSRFPELEGTGRAMRHVKVPRPEDADALGPLIRAAVALDRGGPAPKGVRAARP